MANDGTNGARAARWELRADMRIFEALGLTAIEKLLFLALAGHADSRGANAWPTVGRLALCASCSERHVRRALKRLEELGLIIRSCRFTKSGRQTSNSYSLSLPETLFSSDGRNADGEDEREEQPRAASGHPQSGGLSPRELSPNNSKTCLPSAGGRGTAERGVKGGGREAERELPPAAAPFAMRPAAEYLLLRSGRRGLAPDELTALRELERLCLPSAVTGEIMRAAERFGRLGRPLKELTARYLLASLRGRAAKSGRRGGNSTLAEAEALQFAEENLAELRSRYGGGLQ